MTILTVEQIKTALTAVLDPNLGIDLVTAEVISDIKIEENSVKIKIKLGYPAAGFRDILSQSILSTLQASFPQNDINVDVSWKINSHKVQKGLRGLMGVKNLLVVASGKGGVGKSTVAVNLALSLLAEGAKVGILDADIYGPSQPKMLGSSTGNAKRPEINSDKRMIPVTCFGLQTMSMGYLIDEEDSPMVWRGPMVSSALQQLTLETEWKDLDYLIVDLPPGTGDIQLTLSQKIPVSGAIIVTTPQDIALLDAKKALNMFRKLDVPILGVIENMSAYICQHCGETDPIFGHEGGANMAIQYGTQLLGRLPLNRRIREQADGGNPIVAADPTCEITTLYRDIARKLTARLSLQAKDLSALFPTIVIKNT